jgi:hypothetical protein
MSDRELKSKYAEALYKNESSFDKEINRRFQRLNMDYARSSSIVDSGSQVFLNRIRQKRNKWIQDDLRYREYYRTVCKKVHNKKLENLRQSFDSENEHKLDPINKAKFELLKQQLKLKDAKTNIHRIENTDPIEEKPSTIVKLPDIYVKDFNALYSKYSSSDREFLDKYPAKIELTVTEIGKKFIRSEKQKIQTLKRQKIRNAKLQDSALYDDRFKNLVSYLNH